MMYDVLRRDFATELQVEMVDVRRLTPTGVLYLK